MRRCGRWSPRRLLLLVVVTVSQASVCQRGVGLGAGNGVQLCDKGVWAGAETGAPCLANECGAAGSRTRM